MASRVLRLAAVNGDAAGLSCLGFSACSSLSARILVRMSPKMTVAILPSTASTRPTEVSPFILTVSPGATAALASPALRCASRAASACSSRCCSPAALSRLRFSRRSLRSCIWRIFLAISSSLSLASMPATSCLKAFSSSRMRLVSSRSAWLSRISRMVFSILRLLSRSSSSACSLARRRMSLRLCSSSRISSS